MYTNAKHLKTIIIIVTASPTMRKDIANLDRFDDRSFYRGCLLYFAFSIKSS